MKYFALEYSGFKSDRRINIGDDIQSLAAINLLPRMDGNVPRDELNSVKEPCIVPLNGFFLDAPNWPPSNFVVPIPVAFHISRNYKDLILNPTSLEYLKRFEPIGCRDSESSRLLQSKGIAAYYSKCLTLTLECRQSEPTNHQIYIVGVSNLLQKVIPKTILKNSVYVNQSKLQLPTIPTTTRRALALNLLDSYKKNASLVITSRIHCAMPCIAMGIPVVFLYEKRKKSDYRVHIMEDLVGINYINEHLLFSNLFCKAYSDKIDWSPKPLDIENEKFVIKNYFRDALRRAEKIYTEMYGN